MKKLALITLVVAIILAMAGSAAALSAPDTVTVGGSRQRASNPLANNEDYHNIYAFATVTLTNDGEGAVALDNLRLGTISPLLGFTPEELDITATFSETSLAVDGSTTVTLTVRVPENLNAVDADSLKSALHVANVQFTAKDSLDNDVTAISKLELERENQLYFDSIEVCVNSDCTRVENGDTVPDLKPGDKIEMKVAVENKYRDNDREDLSIEDVFLEWLINEEEIDEEDEADFGDISPMDIEEEVFNFVIDDEVSDGSYDLKMYLSGMDENRALHGEHVVIKFKVKRERHDLSLRDVVVSPKSLVCGSLSRFVTFNVEVANIGKADEDEVILKLTSSKLDLEASSDELEVDESETKTVNLRTEIPEDTNAGVYLFRVAAFYDTSVLVDETEVNFIVPKCEVEEPVVAEPVAPVTPELQPVEPVVDKRVVPEKSNLVEQFTEGNAYLALLVVGIVLAMLILVFLVVRVVPPRKD